MPLPARLRFSAAPRQPRASGAALDVPEERQALQHAGQTAAISCGLKVLAEWQVGHLLERNLLDLACDGLLRSEVGGVEPGLAKFLDAGDSWPPEPRSVAMPTQALVDTGVKHVDARPESAEHAPAATLRTF